MDLNILIGKTIVSAEQYKLKNYDDIGFILLKFDDGTDAIIESKYGGWTSKSIDEYQTLIDVYPLSEKRMNDLEKINS